MSFLDRIDRCNQWQPEQFKPFRVGSRVVGHIRNDLVEVLARFDDVFYCTMSDVSLHSSLDSQEARTQAFAGVVDELIAEGVLRSRFGETYPAVADDRREPLFLLDRAHNVFFGIRSFGQHLNGFVRRDDGIWMWIGRRARDRGVEPDKLDQLVAGGLPWGISLAENLRKECDEEAGIPADLADRAVPVGVVTYRQQSRLGFKPDTLFNYDLELPAGFQPVCNDGEVQSFELMPIAEVARLVRDTEEFKLNCNLVIIDFLIRHGLIDPEEADYPQLHNGLHQ